MVFDEVGDDFYQISPAEAKALMDMAAAKRAQSETFKTKETRDVEAARLKRRYRKAMIRVRLPDGVILQALSQAGAQLLAQQTERFRATPLIKKDQLQEMVAPAGGPLKLKMGIDDVRIEVNENDLQLKVRFAFEQPQLPGS